MKIDIMPADVRKHPIVSSASSLEARSVKPPPVEVPDLHQPDRRLGPVQGVDE
jgi:hypothetical protein